MDRDRRLSLTVGLLVIAAVAAFAVTILSLSAQEGIWRPRYRLHAYFGNVQGLIGGAPVWLAGKQVGRVESVRFGAVDSERPAVAVEMQIDAEVQERIRTDSVATIGTIGLLGDRYVEVSLGSTGGEILHDGDELRTLDPVDLNVVANRGAEALDHVAELSAGLNEVVEEFVEARGGRRLAESVEALGDIAVEVQEGQGLLHSLIYDPYGGKGVESITRSLEILQDILLEVRDGEGVLHSLVYDAPTEQDVVIEALQAGARLNNILGKVDAGQGTLGLMVNDPTLYEDLKLLVGGANRSRLVRTMIDISRDETE
jgi:phospholipid/cholesterol/gamma-HCH transport system substrate-binding protein